MLPHRDDATCLACGFYTYDAFVAAPKRSRPSLSRAPPPRASGRSSHSWRTPPMRPLVGPTPGANATRT
ncbi:unnamed protein product [Urochloa humidicola]